MPWRYDSEGAVVLESPAKERRPFEVRGATRDYVLEESIFADMGLVRAARGDRHGNLVFNRSARNFNPLCAESGVVTIAEVETLGPLGSIDPDAVMTPGVHVDHIVEVGTGDKPIEQRTVRPKPAEKES